MGIIRMDVMRRNLLLALMAVIGIVTAGGENARASEPFTVDMESSVRSHYVWRGEMWTDGPVFWQTATFRWYGFSSWNFFNIDLNDVNGERLKITEYDYIFDYTFRFSRFSAAPGLYHFSSLVGFFEPSTKVTLNITVKSTWNPGLWVSIDTKYSSGSYFIFSAARQVKPLKRLVPLNFYGSVGISQPRYYRNYLDDHWAFTDTLLGISTPFDIRSGFTLSLFAEFTSLLDRSVRKAQDETGARKDSLTVGVSVTRGIKF